MRNRTVKKIIGVTAVACVVWSGLFLTDYDRCSTLREPLFAIGGETENGKTVFHGLGYRIETERDTGGKLRSVKMTIFGKVISESGT